MHVLYLTSKMMEIAIFAKISILDSPRQKVNRSVTCDWETGKKGSCSINFMSNPIPTQMEVTKNGKICERYFMHLRSEIINSR